MIGLRIRSGIKIIPKVIQAAMTPCSGGRSAPSGRGTPRVSKSKRAGEALTNITRIFVVLPTRTSRESMIPATSPINALIPA
jgi:hypothetical protein